MPTGSRRYPSTSKTVRWQTRCRQSAISISPSFRTSSRRAASTATDQPFAHRAPPRQLAPVGPQEPPARRCASLLMGTPQRAGPPPMDYRHKRPTGGSIPTAQSVHPQGRTPIRGQCSMPIDNGHHQQEKPRNSATSRTVVGCSGGGSGGGSGIRTHGTLSRTHAFQACALSRSAIPPHQRARKIAVPPLPGNLPRTMACQRNHSGTKGP